MCGIGGIAFSNRARAKDLRPPLNAMREALRHRGPDDEGDHIVVGPDHAVGICHTRLSIIDLTPLGHQPMVDSASGNWIAFNGEIYNFKSLRELLRAEGTSFASQSDTEVILKSYAMWGRVCVERLRGMFAFALWDATAKVLLLARDPLGVKPLYYYENGEFLVFASEVRALLAGGLVPRYLNVKGLNSYMGFGSLQDPLTMVQDVQSLLPGHTLEWSVTGAVKSRRFWTPGHTPVKSSFDSLLSTTRKHFSDAVNNQTVSDVPVGIFLSGGIDSSSIAAVISAEAGAKASTYCIAFDEQRYDESTHARSVAKVLGTNHYELRLSSRLFASELPEALAAYDQPSVDGLNTYFVSGLVRQAGCKVVLSGLGGDELFVGYDGFRKAVLSYRWARTTRALPIFSKQLASFLLGLLPSTERLRKAKELFKGLPCLDPYFLSRMLFLHEQTGKLLAPGLLVSCEGWMPERFHQMLEEANSYDLINRISVLEIQSYLLSTLLRDADQMSMAHALEVRVPFLDQNLIEFVLSVPGKMKRNGNLRKPLLTRSLDGLLPKVSYLRPKQGFVLPIQSWLAKDLKDDIFKLMCGATESTAAPFTPRGLHQLWDDFRDGRVNWSRVWALYVVRDWLNRNRISLS